LASELLEKLLNTLGPGSFASQPEPATTTKLRTGVVKFRRQASAAQVALLEEIFAMEPIPTALTKARLSQLLDMPVKRVQVWFKNKRARHKKGFSRREPFTFHYFARSAISAASSESLPAHNGGA